MPGGVSAEQLVAARQHEGEQRLAAEDIELIRDGPGVPRRRPIPLDRPVVRVEAAVRDLPGDEHEPRRDHGTDGDERGDPHLP
jgi:hypothetical protein